MTEQLLMRGIGMIVPSLVDGPGERAVVHFAGCAIGCPGCFNPETHDGSGWARDVKSVASEMLAISPRVTVSGGEPTQQPFLLRLLLRELRAQGAQDIVLFSGRTLGWLKVRCPLWDEIEGEIDVLIDGPFIAHMPETVRTCGSTNQKIHYFTDRMGPDDFTRRDTEIQFIDGQAVITGFPDPDLLALFT